MSGIKEIKKLISDNLNGIHTHTEREREQVSILPMAHPNTPVREPRDKPPSSKV
jgi:hypothetical protein